MSDDPARRPGLVLRVRGFLSLTRVQATLGIIAASLSIAGALYGYLKPHVAPAPPVIGQVVAVVQEPSGKAVTDATVEVLTLKDAVVTTLPLGSNGRAQGKLKEGTYRLRVTHPKYEASARQIQVIAGETAEIHVRLNPRASDSPIEGLKKLFK
jgi:hypothetical protein